MSLGVRVGYLRALDHDLNRGNRQQVSFRHTKNRGRLKANSQQLSVKPTERPHATSSTMPRLFLLTGLAGLLLGFSTAWA